MSQPTTPDPPSLSAQLGGIMACLSAWVRPRGVYANPIQPLMAYLWGYFMRAESRLERLVARWHAGRLPRPLPTSPRTRANPPAPRPASARVHMPGANGWLIRMIQPTAQFSGHLRDLVARPDMAELLAAAPQAGRILRPLCRMLAIDLPPNLRLPPKQPAPLSAPQPAPPPATRPAPAAPTTPDRPLQPYVRAAARAWRTRPA